MIRFIASLLILSGPVQQYRPSDPPVAVPSVVTTGRGELRLPPDVAVLRIGIAARASTAAAAATEAGRRVRAVTDTLRLLGLAPQVMEPIALKVGGNEDYSEARLVDYEARAALSVRVRATDQLGALIDGALAVGATDIPAVRFESDTAAAARRHALTRAFERAEASARAIAEAAGMRLGGLLEVSADPDYDFRDEEYLMDIGPHARSPGTRRDVPISASVTARWRLVSRQN